MKAEQQIQAIGSPLAPVDSTGLVARLMKLRLNLAMDAEEYYQSTQFASDYNARALEHLNAALRELNARTEDREKREVEGTHAK